MRVFVNIFFLFLVLYSASMLVKAQQNDLKRIRFNYSFENVTNENQIDLLKKEVEALNNVQSVKTIYKRDSGKGLLIVDVAEKVSRRESEESFDITQLKKIIISNQLTPVELTQEVIKD